MQEESRTFSLEEALDYGAGLAHHGNHTSAATLYRGVLMHEPENLTAILRLGASLFELKQYYEALYWFWRGIKQDRRHPMALTNYGLCLSMLGHWDEGLAYLERAVAQAEKQVLDPDHMALVYNNLGNTLERLRRYPEALVALDKGIAHDPNDHFPHYNRGIVLLRLNRHEEAIAALDRTLELRPGDADAIYNRSMAYLLLGNLKDGFAGYEYRLITSENEASHLGIPGKPNLGLPPEKKLQFGEPMAGKTILVHGEQGIGDTIQFMRYVPYVLARGASVKLVAHSPIRPMVCSDYDVKVFAKAEEAGDYDAWVAIMSLPHYLGRASENLIPAPWQPIIESERVEKWHSVLGLPLDQLNVGVCWAGNFRHKNDLHRSIPLEKFATLFDARGCNFVSVQQMQQRDTEVWPQVKKQHSNLQALWLDDLRDTAAVIENFDLIISVDTAVAHLAGTMGKRTWTLVPSISTDWRWQRERTYSPWYPSMTLYRQANGGIWHPTLQQLKNDLELLAGSMAITRAA